ncbi:MAG: Wzz/FepE/Etk N-terminal domain-containing protein [Planococcus sp. (in: firmicutes)]
MDEGISLREVFNIIGQTKMLIISVVFACGLITGAVSYYILPPVYETSTQILVHQNGSENESAASQNNEADLQLIETYSDIIENPGILTQVSNRLNLDLEAEQMKKKVAVSTSANSHVINITVRDNDIDRAVSIANTTVAVFSEEVSRLLNANNVSVISPAASEGIPTPVGPNILLNTGIAALVGLFFSISLAFLKNYMNTTIRNEQDLEKVLQLSVLAVIPYLDQKEKKQSMRETTVESKGVRAHDSKT